MSLVRSYCIRCRCRSPGVSVARVTLSSAATFSIKTSRAWASFHCEMEFCGGGELCSEWERKTGKRMSQENKALACTLPGSGQEKLCRMRDWSYCEMNGRGWGESERTMVSGGVLGRAKGTVLRGSMLLF